MMVYNKYIYSLTLNMEFISQVREDFFLYFQEYMQSMYRKSHVTMLTSKMIPYIKFSVKNTFLYFEHVSFKV